MDRLFDALTERQLAAIRLALDSGYYEQPGKASISQLADQTAVARTTLEEHLRKAEDKLIGNLGQFVRLMVGSQAENSLGVKASTTPPIAHLD